MALGREARKAGGGQLVTVHRAAIQKFTVKSLVPPESLTEIHGVLLNAQPVWTECICVDWGRGGAGLEAEKAP